MPTRPPIHRPRGWKPPAQQRRDYDQDRGSAASRGYGHEWRKQREAHLAANPMCARCEAPATTVVRRGTDPVILDSRCSNCASRKP